MLASSIVIAASSVMESILCSELHYLKIAGSNPALKTKRQSNDFQLNPGSNHRELEVVIPLGKLVCIGYESKEFPK